MASTNLWRAGAAYRKGDAVQAQQASRQRQRTQQQVPPLSAAERKEVEEAFDLFDADRTGASSAARPGICYCRMCGVHCLMTIRCKLLATVGATATILL
jgi:hypothetical protein